MHGGYGLRDTVIIKHRFAFECDHQSLLEIVGGLSHNLFVRILEDMIPPNFNAHLPNWRAHIRSRAEVEQLVEIEFIPRDVGIYQG